METQLPPRFTTEAEVREAVLNNQRHLERALVALYNQNTVNERIIRKNIGRDRKGFNKVHMKIGCMMGQFVQRRVQAFNHPYGTNLDGKWLKVAKTIVPQYARQLLELNKKKVAEFQNHV